MTLLLAPVEVSCAVEVFIATSLLHQENPERLDFTIREIVNRASDEKINGSLRSGVSVHVSQHCVANKAPNPAKHRMLYATGKHTRRLVLPGDDVHPERTGKIFPDADELPEKYVPLLEWAKERFNTSLRNGEGRMQENAGDRTQHRLMTHLTVAKGMEPQLSEGRTWLGDLLRLRLAGAHLADGVDPDDHVRELREGWE